MNTIQYFNKNTIGLVNITDKHNGLINTACTAEPGKTCSIINACGSALLNSWEELPWTAGYSTRYECWQFAADCTNICIDNSIGLMRNTNNILIPTKIFYGCDSYIEGPHIWTTNFINTAIWHSAIIY